ncbi:hypothetical protein PR202_gb29243 [Eleusine coracana subsp. coracana]|uniref:Retrotransposon gag domain-containing protein n=1 Tax=Eleusine coracana subsp. coracana TaxID=191504 RepID=A0AAV5G025_ELECO|nr:hypothetical protein PR202_gb29243 [Eleusine coracana subsp. coracana]
MHPPYHQFTWAEFTKAFREHHIREGLISQKLKQFLALKQGNMKVHAYSKIFNCLAQYAPEHVDTNAKKKVLFKEGLTTKLQSHIVLNPTASFNEFVNDAIILEDSLHIHKAAKDKKRTSMGREVEDPPSTGWCTLHQQVSAIMPHLPGQRPIEQLNNHHNNINFVHHISSRMCNGHDKPIQHHHRMLHLVIVMVVLDTLIAVVRMHQRQLMHHVLRDQDQIRRGINPRILK